VAPVPSYAPLSLSPNSTNANAAVPPVRAPTRAASVAAPAPIASTSAAPSGNYAVQVSSQRSEAEAQASFRGLQAKYPDQLGGRQAIIHRVDLGTKGTYYRAMVGPFASANEASAMCSSLKAAGGQCLVQRN
jgi:cell division protein FtsN